MKTFNSNNTFEYTKFMLTQEKEKEKTNWNVENFSAVCVYVLNKMRAKNVCVVLASGCLYALDMNKMKDEKSATVAMALAHSFFFVLNRIINKQITRTCHTFDG